MNVEEEDFSKWCNEPGRCLSPPDKVVPFVFHEASKGQDIWSIVQQKCLDAERLAIFVEQAEGNVDAFINGNESVGSAECNWIALFNSRHVGDSLSEVTA